MKAVTCPVCSGSGKYKRTVTGTMSGMTQELVDKCHGCDGKGWVEVKDGDSHPVIVYPYQPWPWQPWPPVIYEPYVTWTLSSGTSGPPK